MPPAPGWSGGPAHVHYVGFKLPAVLVGVAGAHGLLPTAQHLNNQVVAG